MAKLLTYEKKDTWMDELCGVTKLVYFLAWSITSMLTYDTRVLAPKPSGSRSDRSLKSFYFSWS